MEFKCIGTAVLDIVLLELLLDNCFPGRRSIHSQHSMYMYFMRICYINNINLKFFDVAVGTMLSGTQYRCCYVITVNM